MIYSTNRTTSLGEMTIDVNESYFGAGAFTFMQECAQDELAMFETAIKSDIDEAIIGESSYELTALNEGFVEKAMTKIKELMKKFMAWIEAVTRSAIAKLSQLLVRDNGKFVKIARKQLAKMKNMDKFKFKGKYLKIAGSVSNLEKETDMADELFAITKKEIVTETDVEKAEKIKEDINKLSVSDFMEAVTGETEDGGIDLIKKHINSLESYDKKELKKIRDRAKKSKDEAAKILKDAQDTERKLKDDAKDDIKNSAANKVKVASIFKECNQKVISYELSCLKGMIKVCRSVVSKAMGASPKNEGFEVDVELIDAMNEAVLLEYDEALEEMSEAGEVADTDEDILDDEE